MTQVKFVQLVKLGQYKLTLGKMVFGQLHVLREQLLKVNLNLIICCILLSTSICCTTDKTNKINNTDSKLILLLTNEGKLIHTQNTGIPFKEQVSKERVFRVMDTQRIRTIDLSKEHYLHLQVYRDQPCVAKPAVSIVDCFTDSGEIFQRFGMGRGRGPGEMGKVDRFALNDSGYVMLLDLYGRTQKLLNSFGDELLFNLAFPLEDPPQTVGSAGTDKFAYTNGLYLTEPSFIYFEKQLDGTWAKISGANLYDQSKPFGPSQLSDNPKDDVSRDLVGAPTVFNGIMDGHSGGDFINVTRFSGLLIRMDEKKATWARNLITNPMNGIIEMSRKIPDLPEEYRPAYSSPMYYLPKLNDRQVYTYAVKVQDGNIINIDYGDNAAGERGMIFDFYDELDGSYLRSYHFVPGTSLTYLGVQLSGNRLYILNGDGEIVVFEVEFL